MTFEELKKLMEEYPETMSANERMSKYMKGEEVDHIPCILQGPEYAVANVLGYTAKECKTQYEVRREVTKAEYEEFGRGNFNVDLGLKRMGAALGSNLYQPEDSINYIDKFILDDLSELDKLEIPDPRTTPILKELIENGKRMKEDLPFIGIGGGVAGPISTAISILPVEKFLKATRKDPEKVHKLLDFVVDCNLRFVQVLKEEFKEISIGICDPVTCTDIISKKQFEEFSLPAFRKLVDGIKEITGSYPSVHICGSTNRIWADLATCGMDAFSVDNCEDLAEAKAVFGNLMPIIGNVDPVNVMKNGSIEDVIEACIECLKKAADSPQGYVLGTGCQVPKGTPRENMYAFLYAARKYGKNAKKGEVPQAILDLEKDNKKY